LYPNDDWFWKKRAFMAFKNGNKMEAHYYFARAYIVNGMDRYAIEQLSTALEFYNDNKILRSKVNAELQRLKKKQ
jgi:predicted Zn-dependent protease